MQLRFIYPFQEQCDSPRGKAIQHSATVREVCVSWEMEEVYEEETNRLEQTEISSNDRTSSECKKRKLEEDGVSAKKGKEEEEAIGDDVVIVNVAFIRSVAGRKR